MSRKELEIESTYAEANEFTPDERADYEAWLDSLGPGAMAPEIIAEQEQEFPEHADEDLPF